MKKVNQKLKIFFISCKGMNRINKIVYSFSIFSILFASSLFAQTTLFTENFDSYSNGELTTAGFNGWKKYEISVTAADFQIKNSCSPPSGTHCLNMNDGSVDCDYLWDDAGNEIAFWGTKINSTAYNTLRLSFKWKAYGETSGCSGPCDYGYVVWSTDGVSWTQVSATKYMGQSAWQTVSNLSLSAADGQQFYIGFQWINDGSTGTLPGFCIDDILITGIPNCATVGGTSSASTNPICTGSSTTLSLTGQTGGSTYQWQSSSDNSSWSNIGGATSSTYVASPTSSTYYRCVVTNGCSANSSSTLVTVSQNPVGGTASGATTICSGSTAVLTLASSTGSIQWQQSSDNSSWADVTTGSGGTTTSYTTASLTSSMYYRAKLTSSPCAGPVYSNSQLITVIACINMSNGSTTACNGNFYDDGGSGGNYTASKDYTYTINPGATVTIVFSAFDVESHASCGYDYLRIYDGPNTSSTLLGTYCGTNSPGTIVSSGGSLTFFWHSDSGTERPGWTASWSCCSTNPGTASGGTTLCGGGTAALSVSGYTGGSTLQWQSSASSSGPWSNVGGATSATYNASPGSTTYYRCKVTNGCASYSNVVTVTVATTPSTPPTPYALTNPGCGSVRVYEATYPSGTTYYWQGTNSSGTSTSNNTTIPYTATASGTYYVRARNNSTGCWSTASSSLAVTVTGPTGGTVSGNATVCGVAANSTTFTLSGHSGTIIRWEYAVSPYTYWNPISNTSTSCTVTNVSEDTRVRAVIQSSTCSAITSSTEGQITTVKNSTANAGVDKYVCSGTTVSLAASGTGTWVAMTTGPSVTTPSSATSGVTGLVTGANVFQWNVAGTCPDYVVVTRW